MKSRNLTQISLQNDPINRWMQGFSFRIDEDKNWSSRCDFFLLPPLNYDFIHSMGAEMSQEYKETNDLWNGGVNKENLTKFHGQFFPLRRTAFKERRIGRSRWMKMFIAINRRDHTSFGKSSWSILGRSIDDGRSRCDFIAWRRNRLALIIRWMLIQCSWCLKESTGSERSQLL